MNGWTVWRTAVESAAWQQIHLELLTSVKQPSHVIQSNHGVGNQFSPQAIKTSGLKQNKTNLNT